MKGFNMHLVFLEIIFFVLVQSLTLGPYYLFQKLYSKPALYFLIFYGIYACFRLAFAAGNYVSN